jgi:glycosyltransferase involved in cell wall biosynthesis
MTGPSTPIVWFIVESGTDARLLDGLASRVSLKVLARDIPGGRAVSQPTDVPVVVAGSGRIGFAWRVFRTLTGADSYHAVLVQGYAVAALAANIAARLRRRPCWMLVCSPVAEYYETRRAAGLPFSRLTLAAINILARLNRLIGHGYIVLSDYLGEVVQQYGSKLIHVIPVYGVDTRKYKTAKDRAAARAARGLPPTGQIVFSSSRVAPEKDTSTLIDAFAVLVQEGRDVYLLHRSGGYQELLRDADRAGVRDRVIATDAADPRGDLPLDYAAADVCVQASRAEGLGFSVLEALACGTPVIVSAVGGLVETVRNGATGWTVPPGDPAALADALRDALDRPEEARRRAAAGGAIVRERFDSELVFARLASLLSAR